MEECIDLPPGFRFHPTDEEIITHYLSPKILHRGFVARAIGEVDLNKCEPWDLPGKAKMGEKEMYFFCQRDRKYPTGMRTNRATESGYWKATGKDREIYRGKGVLVGMKKTLVFYRGRAPKGEKSNWVMHEFRLEGKHPLPNLPKSLKDEWVVCRVFHKNLGLKRTPAQSSATVNGDHEAALAEYYSPMPAWTEPNQLIDLKAHNYLPSAMMMSAQTNMATATATSLEQAAVVPPQIATTYSSLLGSGSYLHRQDLGGGGGGVIRNQLQRCKVEQYSSNQSIGGCPSQDTAATDISSVISSGNYDTFDEAAWTSYGF